mmetsp:Transcript_80174/g.214204  ORF Transcript_80174/g.214204 Transcript_80174/m.214204 type:complete len:212 (-) Transcript_80174:147-782(-)
MRAPSLDDHFQESVLVGLTLPTTGMAKIGQHRVMCDCVHATGGVDHRPDRLPLPTAQRGVDGPVLVFHAAMNQTDVPLLHLTAVKLPPCKMPSLMVLCQHENSRCLLVETVTNPTVATRVSRHLLVDVLDAVNVTHDIVSGFVPGVDGVHCQERRLVDHNIILEFGKAEGLVALNLVEVEIFRVIDSLLILLRATGIRFFPPGTTIPTPSS